MIYVLLSTIHFSFIFIYFLRGLFSKKHSLVNGLFASCFFTLLVVFKCIPYSQTQTLLIAYLITLAFLLTSSFIEFQRNKSFIIDVEWLEIITYIVTFITIVIFAFSIKMTP